MVEEISLSIEETNKLRATLGLPLIPNPQTVQPAKEAQTRDEHQPSTFKSELSIQETNKLRLVLGLEPIPIDEVDHSPTTLEYSKSEENDHNLKHRLTQAQDRARKRKKLSANVQSLWDDETDNTDDWINKLGKSESSSSTSKTGTHKQSIKPDDLMNGIRIGHSLNELSSIGNNEILTLKDSSIFDIDNDKGDDELFNDDLLRQNKLRQELKEKAKVDHILFNGSLKLTNSDEDENEDNENELDKNGVVISGSSVSIPQSIGTKQPQMKGHIQIASLFDDDEDDSIDDVKGKDYTKSKKPIKMKKMSKKKPSLKNRKDADIVDAPLQTVILNADNDDDDLIKDDQDIERILATKRKQKLKATRSKLTPEQIANEIRQNKLWATKNEIESRAHIGINVNNENGIVFDDTTDFLNSLSVKATIAESELQINKAEQANQAQIKQEPIGGINVKQELISEVSVKEEPVTDIKVKQEPSENINSIDELESNKEHKRNTEVKQESDDKIHVKSESNELVVQSEESALNKDKGIHNENESKPLFNGGLAQTLKFLESRNMINIPTFESQDQARQQREAIRESDLFKLQVSIEQRLVKEELESTKGFMTLPKEEREIQIQTMLDQRLIEKNIVPKIDTSKRNRHQNKYQVKKTNSSKDKLQTYNPQVKLSYRDDSGHELNTKEAFKYLSHQFHGLGPSKNKIDKRIRKQRQDQTDSSLNGSEIL